MTFKASWGFQRLWLAAAGGERCVKTPWLDEGHRLLKPKTRRDFGVIAHRKLGWFGFEDVFGEKFLTVVKSGNILCGSVGTQNRVTIKSNKRKWKTWSKTPVGCGFV